MLRAIQRGCRLTDVPIGNTGSSSQLVTTRIIVGAVVCILHNFRFKDVEEIRLIDRSMKVRPEEILRNLYKPLILYDRLRRAMPVVLERVAYLDCCFLNPRWLGKTNIRVYCVLTCFLSTPSPFRLASPLFLGIVAVVY